MPEEIVVKVENISKQFGKTKAVDGINFEAKAGEVFGLLGPNGAGKTTTIRIMLNLIEEFSGKVEIFGKPVSEETKNSIAYLPEDRGLYKGMKTIEVIKYLASLKGMEEKKAEEKALALMQEMNLLEYKDKKIFELSKGTQQKIQIISAILHNPGVIVLDEPFSGLDPLSVKFVIGIIEKEKREGKTIILSTHNMRIAEEVCDKAIVINKGRRVLYGNIEDIKERYSKNSVIVELAKEEPKAGEKISKILGIKKAIQESPTSIELFLETNAKPEKILKELVMQNFEIRKFESAIPDLETIFISVVEAEKWIKY